MPDDHRSPDLALDLTQPPRAGLPEQVQALSEPMQRAWLARARGGRWKDAAAAAGVPVSTVWAWARTFRPFRDALETAYLPLEDAHRDVLQDALDRGLEPDAPDKALDRALRAAVHVSRGLGMGSSAAATRAPAVSVQVTVGLGDVLGRAAPLPAAPVETWDVDADVVPVQDTQPARARVSSQRTAVERGSARGDG